jgi:glutamate/tyrosine decarboxylase-like PLP-dependent enzyme
MDGFEVGPYPDLSVVTFRYLPQQGDPDAFNQRLTDEIQEDGRIFLSTTQLDGRFVLRLAVLSFRTHLDTIDLTLEILKEKVKAIG